MGTSFAPHAHVIRTSFAPHAQVIRTSCAPHAHLMRTDPRHATTMVSATVAREQHFDRSIEATSMACAAGVLPRSDPVARMWRGLGAGSYSGGRLRRAGVPPQPISDLTAPPSVGRERTERRASSVCRCRGSFNLKESVIVKRPGTATASCARGAGFACPCALCVVA